MLFTSLQFLGFLLVVLILYAIFPVRSRWFLLLAASYYFYASWKMEYVFLIAAITLINYFLGIQIEKSEENSTRNKYLWIGAISNLGILFLFKYFNFFSNSLGWILKPVGLLPDMPIFKLALPVGISFYTFQAFGYIIDVYRKKRPAERQIGIFSLFVSFFPQLLSGPIERANNMLPQYHARPSFQWGTFKNGLALMLWGYFQKLVIADRLGIYVNQVYSHPGSFEGSRLLTATFLFAFQLYSDFSGYTHIAMGVALMLGYRLMDNFNRPFASRSMREFATRWHISLTRWIMDYLFSPLARRARSKWQGYLATIFVFGIIGFWHGAAWNFILFGLIIGTFLVWADFKRPYLDPITARLFPAQSLFANKLRRCLQTTTIVVLIMFACVFFRANHTFEIYLIFSGMFHDFHISKSTFVLPGFPFYEAMIGVLFLVSMLFFEWLDSRKRILSDFAQKPVALQFAFYYVVFLVILIFGQFQLLPFLYFQF